MVGEHEPEPGGDDRHADHDADPQHEADRNLDLADLLFHALRLFGGELPAARGGGCRSGRSGAVGGGRLARAGHEKIPFWSISREMMTRTATNTSRIVLLVTRPSTRAPKVAPSRTPTATGAAMMGSIWPRMK